MRDHKRLLVLLAFAAFGVSCTDPVRDRAVERLGPEQGGVPEGPLHRPGQPCVVCHSEGGPASDHKFAVAGTIYDSAAATKGAENVRVFFIDGLNVDFNVVSNEVGNFYVREEEWNLTFPFKTGVRRGDTPIRMNSPVNREGSCNFCHLPGGDPRQSIAPIFAPGGTP